MTQKRNHGRGADSNPPNRFEKASYDESLDIELPEPEPGEERPAIRTRFFKDKTRTILTENQSPDVGFRFSINAYRGCEHGCAYCYARPTHEYLGLSAGVDFESKIFVKETAPALLREKLLTRSWKPEVICMSGNTDCYQPAEKHFRLTRQCLEVMNEFRNPAMLITKNHSVTRDLDVLSEMAAWNGIAVHVSVTTLDSDLCTVLEPRTSRPSFRLQAIRELSQAGIPVGAMVAPCIPGLTDHEMPKILEAVAEAGARFAGFVPLRLPFSVQTLFTEWLAKNRPERQTKVLNHIRSIRGGKLNDPDFGTRMRGSGPFADQLRQMFKVYSRKYGLNQSELELSASEFRRPGEQMKLF